MVRKIDLKIIVDMFVRVLFFLNYVDLISLLFLRMLIFKGF